MFRRRKLRWPKWWNGRHARLRGVWRKPCGFKSRLRHQTQGSRDRRNTPRSLLRRQKPSPLNQPLLLSAGSNRRESIHLLILCANIDPAQRHPNAARHTDKRPYRTRVQLHCEMLIISNRLIRLDAIMPNLWAIQRSVGTKRVTMIIAIRTVTTSR